MNVPRKSQLKHFHSRFGKTISNISVTSCCRSKIVPWRHFNCMPKHWNGLLFRFESFSSLYSMTCDMLIIEFCEIIPLATMLEILRTATTCEYVSARIYLRISCNSSFYVRACARSQKLFLWSKFSFLVYALRKSDLSLIVCRIDINLLRATATGMNWFFGSLLFGSSSNGAHFHIIYNLMQPLE